MKSVASELPYNRVFDSKLLMNVSVWVSNTHKHKHTNIFNIILINTDLIIKDIYFERVREMGWGSGLEGA